MRNIPEENAHNFVSGLDPKKAYRCYTVTYGTNYGLKSEEGIGYSFQQSGPNKDNGIQCVNIGPITIPIISDSNAPLPRRVNWVGVKNNDKYGIFNLTVSDDPQKLIRSDDFILINFSLRPMNMDKNARPCYGKITGDRQFVNRLGFEKFPGCIISSARVDNSHQIVSGNKVSSGIDALVLLRKDETIRITPDHNVYYVGPFHQDFISSATAKMHLKLNAVTKVDNFQVRDLKAGEIIMPDGFMANVSEEDTSVDSTKTVIGEDCYFLRYDNDMADLTWVTYGERYYDSEGFGFIPLPVFEKMQVTE